MTIPESKGKPKTLRELVRLIRELGSPDEDFSSDLEAIHREQGSAPDSPEVAARPGER